MSLPPIVSADFTAVPDKGTSPLRVTLTSQAFSYDAIEQTGNAQNVITQSGNREDYIRQE